MNTLKRIILASLIAIAIASASIIPGIKVSDAESAWGDGGSIRCYAGSCYGYYSHGGSWGW